MVKFLGYLKKKFKIHVFVIFLVFLLGILNLHFFTNFRNYNQIFFNDPSEIRDDLIGLNNGENNSLNSSSDFEMCEFANISSSKTNISSINIDIPSSGWNLTSIEFNFTDISLKQETITLASENDVSDVWVLQNNNIERLSMQIKVTEQVKINSIEIYGFSSQIPEDEEVYVGITDWNSADNVPDLNTIYGDPIPINISNIPTWYVQKFSNPINLDPGDYAFVLDGYGRIGNDIQYYWFMNESNPNPLYMGYYYRFLGWRWGKNQYDVFCHKINQWVNRSYKPSEINMTASINEIPYEILEGLNVGTGYLNIYNLNYIIPDNILHITISTNGSIQINFNLNYTISINNLRNVDLLLHIKEGKENDWKIFPNLERYPFYYSVSFQIPTNWFNLSLYKDDIEISSDPEIIYQNYTLTIKNDTITANSDWLIAAQSDRQNFAINIQKTSYNPADEIEIEIGSSFLNGEFNFILLDSIGQEKSSQTKSVNAPTEIFSYIVRSNDRRGTWNALIFWNNQTDAGVENVSFIVEIPFVITPFLIFLISIISIGAVSSVYGTYKIIKRRKRIQQKRKQKIIDKCMDIVNLNHILVTDKKSSLTLFDQKYVEKALEANLISGFLQAIRSFGIELTDTKESSQIIKLEYKNLKVIMDEYSNFRIIAIMKEIPSNEFLNSIKDLSYELEEKFGKYLENFNGDIRPFKYIDRLIIKHLNGELLHPLKLEKVDESKFNQEERTLISKISKLRKIKESEYVFFRDLVHERACDPEEIIIINKLIEQRILKPILNLNED
ncbi:MAG: hypothetical protein ACQERB_04210 [Promethearchaeati archaeon]